MTVKNAKSVSSAVSTPTQAPEGFRAVYGLDGRNGSSEVGLLNGHPAMLEHGEVRAVTLKEAVQAIATMAGLAARFQVDFTWTDPEAVGAFWARVATSLKD